MKFKTAVVILLAFLVFCGASPWEGAAVTAPEGELPAKGRYVATNSFPRNTVVDIINIETNKSTRAIVANGLDSPGLLALVSREAADLIGMRAGSVSRIRMIQPSDPIAYLRFKDGLNSGITDYDSGNVITEEKYREEWYEKEVSEAEPPAPVKNAPPVVAREAPPYFLEPEWSESGRKGIVDLPSEELGWVRAEEETVELAEEPEETAEEIVEAEVEEIEEIAEVEEEIEEADEEIAELEEEEFEEVVEEIAEVEEEPEPEPEYIAEEEPEPEVESEPEIAAVEEEEELPTEYVLVEDEERPPVNDIYGIDPSSIIPGLSLSESISEIEDTPVEEIAAEPAVETPVYIPETNFSVRRIYELERGKYYVQIAAVDAPESVESAIIDDVRSYSPVVYKDGDHFYRVLLGPLNQGESAAILQRSKSFGYKDAFVRYSR